MTWENIEYRLNDERVTAANVGSFRQLPIRPAYALSVHKAQGLTVPELKFVRGKGCFAHGMLYVALSRCRSLDGLALESPIQSTDLIVDATVMRFEMFLELSARAYLNHAIHFLYGFTDAERSITLRLACDIWNNYQREWIWEAPDYLQQCMEGMFDEENSVAWDLLEAVGVYKSPGLNLHWADAIRFCFMLIDALKLSPEASI